MENMWQLSHWTWWIAGVLLVVVEVVAPGTFFLWMGVSAGVVGVVLYLAPGIAWEIQLAIFAACSLLSILLSRKYLQKSKEETSTLGQRGKRYIGMVVLVEDAIANGIGKVRVEDTLWRVQGPDVEKGSRVRIVDINGATFQVEKHLEGERNPSSSPKVGIQ